MTFIFKSLGILLYCKTTTFHNSAYQQLESHSKSSQRSSLCTTCGDTAHLHRFWDTHDNTSQKSYLCIFPQVYSRMFIRISLYLSITQYNFNKS